MVEVFTSIILLLPQDNNITAGRGIHLDSILLATSLKPQHHNTIIPYYHLKKYYFLDPKIKQKQSV